MRDWVLAVGPAAPGPDRDQQRDRGRCGVIGRTKFHYDVWGDDVNVAARMESHGEPGRIQLARGTVERLSAVFRTSERGAIAVKGKGELRTWWLDGESEAP